MTELYIIQMSKPKMTMDLTNLSLTTQSKDYTPLQKRKKNNSFVENQVFEIKIKIWKVKKQSYWSYNVI